MPKNTIIHNPVDINIQISKSNVEGYWQINSSLIAFPVPVKPQSKNIIFLLDNSGSMGTDARLDKVKTAVSNLLDKLTEIDTFSIVSFNSTAQIWVTCKHATQSVICHAKSQIQLLHSGGNTDFLEAFGKINTRAIIPNLKHTTVIFLTDGESNCQVKDLCMLFPGKKFPRVIPIGIGLYKNQLLDDLAALNPNTKALYINDKAPVTYQKAFEEAFKQAMERSETNASLDMILKAKGKNDHTLLNISRPLNHISYDGTSTTNMSYFLHSPTPPHYLKLHFHCDRTSLCVEHTLKSEEYDKLKLGQSVDIKIRSFKWKNNSALSWTLAIGSFILGLLLLANTASLILMFPQFNLWLLQTVFASLTVVLLSYGIFDMARKMIYWPSKVSNSVEKEYQQSKLPFRQENQNVPQISSRQQRFFSFTQTCASVALATGGGVVGYYAGTATAAANIALSAGISPPLFIAGCAASGGMAALLLAYGCIKSCEARIESSHSTRQSMR